MRSDFWRGKKVLITGHTGFKGGWLSHWLSKLGADVHGFSLKPNSTPNFFTETNLSDIIASSDFGDIRDVDAINAVFKKTRPEIIFHMAAQALVRKSYKNPIETFSTNIMGTVNVFEAARTAESVRAIVNITTDKCYENEEWFWPYRETDKLGGHDPYSSSKACSEVISETYRKSFFSQENIYLASVRAGNVIGGGDWSKDRLLPDFFRAADKQTILKIRSPNAIRPWQHVLEPLSGYISLAERLISDGDIYAEPWNFAPNDNNAKSVCAVLNALKLLVPSSQWELAESENLHEAKILKLDNSKAKAKLSWTPILDLNSSLSKTVEWHEGWKNGVDLSRLTVSQIANYEGLLKIK